MIRNKVKIVQINGVTVRQRWQKREVSAEDEKENLEEKTDARAIY